MYKSGPLSNLASQTAAQPTQIASIPLGTIFLTQPNATTSPNSDGTTGVAATQFATFQTWIAFPADDIYSFNVRAFPTLAATLSRANMIQVWVDEIPIPADNAPATAPWSQFATGPINVAATDHTFTAPVFAGTHIVCVALCTAQNIQLNLSDASQPQGVHGERLIVNSTNQGILPEPAGSRDPYLQPGSSLHFSRTSFGGNAQWGNANQAIASGTYSTTTGVITINLVSASPFVANQACGIALASLTGTGAFASLNGNWPCLTSSGSQVTIQGPANLAATTITGGNALDADLNIINTASAFINANITSFGYPLYQGQLSDAPGSWLNQTKFGEQNIAQGTDTIIVDHVPAGMQPAGGGDAVIAFGSASNKRYFYVGSNVGAVVGQNITVGNGGIVDSYTLNHATHQENTSVVGLIRADDVLVVGAINHTLHCGFSYAMVNNQTTSGSTDGGWPAVGMDYNAAVHPISNTLVSGTYNTANGAIVLTCVTSLGYPAGGFVYVVGQQVQVYGLTGTGANLSLLNSVFTVTAVSGATVSMTGPTGLGTITITGGTVSGPQNWCQWGSLLGIPASTAKPGGLTAGGSMLWDCAQRYGFLMNNQAGNQNQRVVTLYGDVSLNGNATMTQIQNAFPTILAACNVMRNNTPATVKGGGIPNIATQSGLVSRSTYPILPFTLPPPNAAAPFQVAVTSFNLTSGQQLTTIATVQAGSLIFLAITPQGAGVTVTSVTDTVGNAYIRCASAPITAPNTNGQDIWACVNTSFVLSSGSHITINLSSGQCNANAYASSTASGGLDKAASAVSTTSVSSFSLASGATTTANQLVIGAANSPVGGGRFISNQDRINNVNTPELYDTQANPFNIETWLVITAAGNPVFNPFWSSGFPSPYAACICTFIIGNPPPSITSVSPNRGSISGNTPVTITGSKFTGATSVTFDGLSPTSVNVVNDGTITCVTPANSTGPATIIVTAPNGQGSNASAYTYQGPPTLTSPTSPPSGSTAGGTSVTLSGNDFTGATTVSFGAPGNNATGLNVVNNTTITCFTPPGSLGAVSVVVTTPFGANGVNSAYTYTAPGGAPVVTGISDAGTGQANGSTAGNRPVTITGSNFTGATSVTLGGVAATIVSVASGSISCRTGPHAAGLVSVAVTTSQGTGSNSIYTYRLVDGAGTALTLPTTGSASATWGFSTLSFQEEFNDLLSVQVNATGYDGNIPANVTGYVTPAQGYNFYTQNFGWANTKFMGSFQQWLNGTGGPNFSTPSYQFYLSQYFSVTSSVLTMNGHTTGADTLAELNSTAFVSGAPNNFVGTTINCANGWYIETRVASAPTVNDASPSAVWAVDNRALTGQITDTYTEIDFVETHTAQHVDINTLLWFSNFATQGLGHSSIGNAPTQATFTYDTAFHIFGALFVPGSRPGGGFLRYYIDGALHSEVSMNIPNGSIGATLAAQLLELKVATNSNINTNPFQVDYIRIWQLTPTG